MISDGYAEGIEGYGLVYAIEFWYNITLLSGCFRTGYKDLPGNM